MNQSKVFVVTGPTASGKTSLALKLAAENNGELINADSRQIYKYLDIGTDKRIRTLSSKFEIRNDWEIQPNKIFDYLKREEPYLINEIPIHLISFVEPDERFDVYTYQSLCYMFINDIIERGKTPILVGGTGLYINAVVKGYKFGSENKSSISREQLENLSLDELVKEIDPEIYSNMNESDRNNPRRLIRAIERGTSSMETDNSLIEKYDFEIVSPRYDWEELKEKIRKRVNEMVESGIVEEVENVLDLGFSKSSIALQGIGYREVLEYLNGQISKANMTEKIQKSHIQYARRQKTWFRNK